MNLGLFYAAVFFEFPILNVVILTDLFFTMSTRSKISFVMCIFFFEKKDNKQLAGRWDIWMSSLNTTKIWPRNVEF